MVKTSPFNVAGRGVGLILDQGAKIPHALQPDKKKRKENRSNIVTNYIKAFLKMVHILKRNAGMLNLTKFLSPM